MPPQPELTKTDLVEFITLWFKEFGEILTEEEARIEAEKLLQLYATLYAASPRERGESEEGYGI